MIDLRLLEVGEQCGGGSCDDYMEAHRLLLGSAHHGLGPAAHVAEVRLNCGVRWPVSVARELKVK